MGFWANLPEYAGFRNPGYQIAYLCKSLALSRRIGYAWGKQVALQRLRKVLRESLSY